MFIFHPSMVFIIHPPGGRVLVRARQASCVKYILDSAGLLIIKSLQRACLGGHYDRSQRSCPGAAERRKWRRQRRTERTPREPRLPWCYVSATHAVNNQFKVSLNTQNAVFSDHYGKNIQFLANIFLHFLQAFCGVSCMLSRWLDPSPETCLQTHRLRSSGCTRQADRTAFWADGWQDHSWTRRGCLSDLSYHVSITILSLLCCSTFKNQT